MTRPQPLPDDIGDRPFDRAALLANRRSKGRSTRKDLVHPFHGVHATAAPDGLLELCRAYAVRMRPGQSFCHTTAALLHGLPLPSRLEGPSPLHVAAVRPASPPRTRGVIGHRLTAAPVLQPLDGLPVCAPTEAWVQLALDLTLDELIEVADHLLTVSPLLPEPTRRLMERRIGSRRQGGALLRAALEAARCPVLSPGETRVRLLLVRAGLPEPECDGEVHDEAGACLGKPDLMWRHQRVGLEYEGAGHALPKQMRADIERYERFRDEGWTIVRASSDDLVGERAAMLVARVGRFLGA